MAKRIDAEKLQANVYDVLAQLTKGGSLLIEAKGIPVAWLLRYADYQKMEELLTVITEALRASKDKHEKEAAKD